MTDLLGTNNNPKLSEIFHLGNFTDITKPIGWDDEGFRKIFPTKDLPFQTVEEVKFGESSKAENKLIWGDNLSVMRSLPDESLDLIYIDPPFFSGRNYNLIFGDQDEERTFRDIWDGGLQTYLAWMNARFWEMKRLLKSTGCLYVHVDWHAAHYLKVELDKIFGYERFLNELIWNYATGGASKERYARKHDNILFYSKSENFRFFPDRVREERTEKSLERARNPKGARISADNTKKLPTDVWQIQALNPMASERIGYPTQKPEELIAKIVLASSDAGDVVSDFFLGGGTTAAVAQKLGRRWIGCDISRVALQVASDRIAKLDPKAGIEIPDEKAARKFHHQIIHHKEMP